jgi:hypothetical protein
MQGTVRKGVLGIHQRLFLHMIERSGCAFFSLSSTAKNGLVFKLNHLLSFRDPSPLFSNVPLLLVDHLTENRPHRRSSQFENPFVDTSSFAS